MSWGPGLTALLGAGALFWTIGNSVRRDTKAEVAALATSTDRKMDDLREIVAANARDIAALSEAQAKNTTNIANLEKSIDKLEVKLEKHAAENAKGFAELRESQDKGMAELRASQDKGFAELRESQAKTEVILRESIDKGDTILRESQANYAAENAKGFAELRESQAKTEVVLREFIAKTDASIARIEAAVTKH